MHAVVTGGNALGENDRVVRLLCAELGRVDAVARGARRSKRRFAGALDPGTRVDVDLRGARAGKLPSIVDLTVRTAPNRARRDLDRLALLAYGCEVCAALAPEHAPAERLYGLLEAWLDLTEAEPGPGLASRVALEAKALTFAGMGPALVTCSSCGDPMDDPAYFDLDGGGAVHARCGHGKATTSALLVDIERLRRTPLRETPGVAFPGPPWLLSDFVRYHLQRPIRSRALLEDLQAP